MESTGTSVNELTLGGRFLKSEYTSEFMLVFEGSCDDAGSVRTMLADYTDAASGKPAKMKGITAVVGDGDLFRSMEVVYKRK
jgi:hypothetical protein